MENKELYKLKFSRIILVQFANTFNDSNAALAELIANSYDAQAKNFEININTINRTIIISDDGIGMNKEDINEKFLDIGDNKRKSQMYMDTNRKVMGRKGSGRLGVFSFANKMYVTSKKINENICNVVLDLSELINDFNKEPYSEIENLKIIKGQGTIIQLSEIEADLNFIFKNLNKYITVHFSHVINNENDIFNIKLMIDNQEQQIAKKPQIFNKLDRFIPLAFNEVDFKKWDDTITLVKMSDLPTDENDIENGYNPNDSIYKKDRIIKIDENKVAEYNKGKILNNKLVTPPWKVECKNLKQQKQTIDFNISGWIGTLSSIEDKEGKETDIVNHGLIIYSRNRVVVSNMIKDIKTDRFYQSYIVGEIFAEDLDNDELIDIINISRDNFSDQDERYPNLKQQVLTWINLLMHEKEKIKKELKTNIATKTNSNIMSQLKISGISEETIKKTIAPIFGKETGYKMTSSDPIIFISYMSLEKSPNSYYMSKVIYEIFKRLNIRNYNVSIIYTASIDDGVPFGENIMDYLKTNALATYLERVVFIACITENYITNWYTTIEYGASWITGKKPFVLIDKKDSTRKFEPPLVGIKYFNFEKLLKADWKLEHDFEKTLKMLTKVIEEILKSLKIVNAYSTVKIKETIEFVLNDNPYFLSTIRNNSHLKQENITNKTDDNFNTTVIKQDTEEFKELE